MSITERTLLCLLDLNAWKWCYWTLAKWTTALTDIDPFHYSQCPLQTSSSYFVHQPPPSNPPPPPPPHLHVLYNNIRTICHQVCVEISLSLAWKWFALNRTLVSPSCLWIERLFLTDWNPQLIKVYTYTKSDCPEFVGGHLGHHFLKPGAPTQFARAIGHRATA